jgi:integrase
MSLTKTAIDRFRYEGSNNKKDVRWDDSLSGFGVRIYPSGKKSFVLFYRARGRQRFMVLGQYGPLTLEQARRMATTKLAEVIGGSDPIVTKHRATRGKTLKDLCIDYIEFHAKPHKRSWRKDLSRLTNHVIPHIGNLRVNAIVQSDIAELHRKVTSQTRYEANRVLEVLSTMFNKATSWGYDISGNPAKGIQENREVKRDRWLRAEEIQRFAEALESEPNLYARKCLWLLLLTGCRKNELLTLTWQNVDMFGRRIALPDTKSSNNHSVPLSEEALALLRTLPREIGNPYVFPGSKAGQHLVNIDKAWYRVRKAAKITDVRIHDLRRSVGSWLAQSGYSLHLIGNLLNHASPQTTAVYARLAEGNVRDALQEHGSNITLISSKVAGGMK